MGSRERAREKAKQAWDKKIFLLPNLFTTANMFCGFYAVVLAFQGRFMQACWVLMLAMIFDSMDGRVARMTRSTSDFGLQYDSLSDLISFGLAPALMVYLWALQPHGRLGWLLAFFYLVCAALRLARFNVMVGNIPKGFFQGMPSPLSAATLVTSILFFHAMELESLGIQRLWFAIPLMLFCASLMVSSVPFPSFKDFKMSRENSFRVLALFALVMTLIAVRPEVTLFIMCLVYISGSLLYDLYGVVMRRPKVFAAVESDSESTVDSRGTS